MSRKVSLHRRKLLQLSADSISPAFGSVWVDWVCWESLSVSGCRWSSTTTASRSSQLQLIKLIMKPLIFPEPVRLHLIMRQQKLVVWTPSAEELDQSVRRSFGRVSPPDLCVQTPGSQSWTEILHNTCVLAPTGFCCADIKAALGRFHVPPG